MENKRKALGRGLEQLFSNESLYNMADIEKEIVENSTEKDVVEVKVSELRSNPYQPRRTFDQEKLVELANSIKEHGVIQPIIVTKSIKGYDIVAGERRKKACELIGRETVPAIIREFTDTEMMEIALLENIQRENLTAIEEAEAYANIIKSVGITQEELADKIGKSRTYITNVLGLLTLPEEVKNDILYGYISMGHARVLSKLNDRDKIIELSIKVKQEKLSVRELEQLVSEGDFKKTNPINRTKTSTPFKYVEEYMRELIGNKVKIDSKKITIPYNSEKDLARILEILKIDMKVD